MPCMESPETMTNRQAETTKLCNGPGSRKQITAADGGVCRIPGKSTTIGGSFISFFVARDVSMTRRTIAARMFCLIAVLLIAGQCAAQPPAAKKAGGGGAQN